MSAPVRFGGFGLGKDELFNVFSGHGDARNGQDHARQVRVSRDLARCGKESLP